MKNDTTYRGLFPLDSETAAGLSFDSDPVAPGGAKARIGIYDDTIYGDSGNNILQGGAGNDSVYGGGGDDLIFGGYGVISMPYALESAHSLYYVTDNDLLVGGSGCDTVYGGKGNDRIFGDFGPDDIAILNGAGSLPYLGKGFADHLLGGDGADVIHGGSGDDRIYGGNGDDLLYGDHGQDYLFGGAGDDTIDGGGDIFLPYLDDVTPASMRALIAYQDSTNFVYAGLGNDTVRAGFGDDTVYGGRGNDMIFGQMGNDRLKGGAGNDTIDGGLGLDVISGGAGNDEIIGGPVWPIYYIALSAGDSSTGPAEITPLGGVGDRLFGGLGNDVITGSYLNDFLAGGRGRDVLTGGYGNDRLAGGRGADNFVFDSSTDEGRDVITDFTTGQDKIALTGDIFSSIDAVAACGENTVITLAGGTQIVLLGVDADLIGAEAFIFV